MNTNKKVKARDNAVERVSAAGIPITGISKRMRNKQLAQAKLNLMRDFKIYCEYKHQKKTVKELAKKYHIVIGSVRNSVYKVKTRLAFREPYYEETNK